MSDVSFRTCCVWGGVRGCDDCHMRACVFGLVSQLVFVESSFPCPLQLALLTWGGVLF